MSPLSDNYDTSKKSIIKKIDKTRSSGYELFKNVTENMATDRPQFLVFFFQKSSDKIFQTET